MPRPSFSRQYTKHFHNRFAGRLQLKWATQGCISEEILPRNVQYRCGVELYVFDTKLPKTFEIYYLEPALCTCVTDFAGGRNTLMQVKQKHSKCVSQKKVSWRTQEIDIFVANVNSDLAFFSTGKKQNFGNIMGNEFGVMLRGKDCLKQKLLTSLCAYNFSWYKLNRPDGVSYC